MSETKECLAEQIQASEEENKSLQKDGSFWEGDHRGFMDGSLWEGDHGGFTLDSLLPLSSM